MRESTLQTKVSGEGRGGGAAGAGAEIPLQPVVQTMVRQLCTCSPWSSTVEQRSACGLWSTPHWHRGMCLKKAVTPGEACAGAGSWQDLWTSGERSPC